MKYELEPKTGKAYSATKKPLEIPGIASPEIVNPEVTSAFPPSKAHGTIIAFTDTLDADDPVRPHPGQLDHC